MILRLRNFYNNNQDFESTSHMGRHVVTHSQMKARCITDCFITIKCSWLQHALTAFKVLEVQYFIYLYMVKLNDTKLQYVCWGIWWGVHISESSIGTPTTNSYVQNVWLTYISSQDIFYLFLLKTSLNYKLVISIYGSTRSKKTLLALQEKSPFHRVLEMQLKAHHVPNSANRNAKRCLGCRCNLKMKMQELNRQNYTDKLESLVWLYSHMGQWQVKVSML